MVRLSVIIPFHNAPRHLAGCLSALDRSNYRAHEIILVDDASTDDSARIARRFADRLVTLSTNRGPAYARNRGVEEASGDVLVFLDADVRCLPDTLAIIARTMQENPDIAAIIGSYDDDPPEPNFLSRYKNLTHHFVHQTSSLDASTFWGGCGAIRRNVFIELDGFDESYRRPSIEDIELGYRLRQAAGKIRLCKEVMVKHAKRWTWSSLLRSDIRDRAIPWTMLQLGSGKILNDLNTTTTQRLCAVLVYTGLSCAVLSIWRAWLFPLPLLCFWIVTYANRSQYRFYFRRGGIRFAVGSVLMHWLYYLYSVVAFGIGFVKFRYTRGIPTASGPRLFQADRL